MDIDVLQPNINAQSELAYDEILRGMVELDNSKSLYKDSGLIYVYFANNQGSKEYSISSIDLDIIVDIIAMGALAQLDSNPNCIFYYLPEGNTLDYAFGKRWITK